MSDNHTNDVVTSKNILDHMFTSCSRDVLRHIFAFCGEGIMGILRLVSGDVNMHITTHFMSAEYSRFTLQTYGAQCGRLDIIRWGLDMSSSNIPYKIACIYCRVMDEFLTGYRFGCQTIYSNKFIQVCIIAAINGHLEMTKFACAHNDNLLQAVCKLAIKYDQLEILIWAHATLKKKNITGFGIVDILINAVYYDRVSILKWAREVEPISFDMDSCCKLAIRDRKIEILQWIISTGHVIGFDPLQMV